METHETDQTTEVLEPQGVPERHVLPTGEAVLRKGAKERYAALMAYAASMDPDEWYHGGHGHGD